jgi:hypothetical protein
MPQMREDANFITMLMNAGELFPSVADESHRATLLSSLLDRKGRILSLYSLVQDTLILQPCAKSLKSLVQPGCKDLRDALMRSFNGTGNAWTIQVAENAVESVPDDQSHSTLQSQENVSTAAYVQLWLFSIRFIESLTDVRLPGSNVLTTHMRTGRPHRSQLTNLPSWQRSWALIRLRFARFV